MLARPWLLYGLAALAVAALLPLSGSQAPAHIAPGEAQNHMWDRVAVQGVVVERGDGGFLLVGDGGRLAVRWSDPPQRGSWVEVVGQVGRSEGDVALWADHVDQALVPDGAEVPLPELARDAAMWDGRVVRVRGVVGNGELHDGQSAIRLGEGPWPATGEATGVAVTAVAVIAYDAGCACYRLHADRTW